MAPKGLSIVNRGMEDIAAIELRELCSCESEKKNGYLTFNASEKELCAFSYFSQSSERVALLLDEFPFKQDPFEQAGKSLIKASLPDGTYKVLSIRKGQHSFNSDDVMKKVGGLLSGLGKKCDMKNPQNVLIVFITGDICCLGLDVPKLDLHKREYRIFTNPSEIRATVAYDMVRFSGFRERETLLDPFCNSGAIVIEAALFATKRSPRFYEKAKLQCGAEFGKLDRIKETESKIIAVDANNRNVVSTKKNAKIAGVLKDVTFSRSDVEWMDMKFQKGAVDRIVTKLPDLRKDGNREKMVRIYDEFFYNAEYILKKNGSIVVMSESMETQKPIIEKYGFSIMEERLAEMGKQERHIYLISKSSASG